MNTQPLKRQLIYWAVLLVVVPSLLIMTIYTIGQITVAKQKNLELIGQRVAFQKQLIDYWLEERAVTVRELSQVGPFRELDEQHMRQALDLMQQSDANFDSLSYIDKDGIFRMSTLPQGIRYPSAAGKPYYEYARAGKEYISDVVIGRNSGQAIINFSCPVYDNSDTFQGLILGSLRTSTLERLLRENWIGQTGEIILVSREGLMLTEPRFLSDLTSRRLSQSSEKFRGRISAEVLKRIQVGQSGTATWIDHQGNKVLGAYFQVPVQDWTLIGQISEDEVLSPIYYQLKVMAGGTIFLTLLIFLLATLITNQIKRPIDWLIAQSNMVAAEEYTAIGHNMHLRKMPWELEVLCQTFIKMSNKIERTIGLLKEQESNLKNKVLEIQQVNKALEGEIKDRQKAEVALQRRLEMEEVLGKISRKLISCPIDNIDLEIDEALKIVGKLAQADHCAVFLANIESSKFIKKYFWLHELAERLTTFPSFAMADNSWEREQFERLNYFAVSNTADLPPEGKTTEKFMKAFNWKSMLVFPVLNVGKLHGFLVLATVFETRIWNQDQVAWLKIVTELVINSIERRRVHDALVLRDQEYRALMDAVPDMFFEIDKNGVFHSARGLLSRYLLTPEQVTGKNVFDVYPGKVAQTLLDNVKTVIATKLMKTFEYDIVIDNKSHRREARIVSKKDNEALVVIRDITEESLAKQKIVEAARLMEEGQRLASLGVIATSIAHEINQPLNSIKVSASGMIFAHNNGVRLNKANMLKEFELIFEQVDRVDDIIKNIKMFVKNDYSAREAISLESVINQAIKTISGHPMLQEVSIKIYIADRLPSILANHIHLQQVIINLMVNAAQSIARSCRSPKMINISAWAEDNVILEVCDNGLGLPEDTATRIFEPFYSGKADDQAMGLGLSIVQAIVYAYGGEIHAYNNDLGGATFHIAFPRLA